MVGSVKAFSFTKDEALAQLRAFVKGHKEHVDEMLQEKLDKYLGIEDPTEQQACDMILYLYRVIIPCAYGQSPQRAMWQQSMRYQMLFLGSQFGLKVTTIIQEPERACQPTV